VSIGSLQSNPWANPWASPWAASATPQSGTKAPGNAAPAGSFVEINQIQVNLSTSASNAPSSGQSTAGTTGASPANPLQSLASDIQAMLIQAQSSAPTGGAAASTTTTASPEQRVAADLQTIMGDIQSAIAPNTQTANSNPTAPTGETEHHHHHHHHDGGGEANGASDVAATSTSLGNGASGTGVSTAGS
jgi:hypothetical protein